MGEKDIADETESILNFSSGCASSCSVHTDIAVLLALIVFLSE